MNIFILCYLINYVNYKTYTLTILHAVHLSNEKPGTKHCILIIIKIIIIIEKFNILNIVFLGNKIFNIYNKIIIMYLFNNRMLYSFV